MNAMDFGRLEFRSAIACWFHALPGTKAPVITSADVWVDRESAAAMAAASIFVRINLPWLQAVSEHDVCLFLSTVSTDFRK
jgi:hypothetical protein